MTSAGLCEMCLKPASKTCTKCRNSRYCSHACRKRGLKEHKLLCSTFSSFGNAARPSQMHRRAIYFPVDKAHPRFIWLPFTRQYEEEIDDTYDSPVRGDLLGQDTGIQLIPIKDNGVLRRRLDHTITLMIREAGLIDGSAMNQSVKSILGGSPWAPCNWAGPIIAYGEKGLAMDPNESDDLDMADFRHVIDRLSENVFIDTGGKAEYLITGTDLEQEIDETMSNAPGTEIEVQKISAEAKRVTAKKQEIPQPILQGKSKEMVAGIRISCGMEVAKGRPKYETVEIPADDAVFFQCPVSEISQRIGLPIITYKAPDCLHCHAGIGELPDGYNAEASSLHIVCDPNARDWGTSSVPWIGPFKSPTWSDDVGSVIVARRDKKPLYPEHVEALCAWCRLTLLPMFIRAMGLYGHHNRVKKEDVLHEVSRVKFAAYYDAWSAGKGQVETLSCSPFLAEFKGKYGRAVPFIERADAPQPSAQWTSLGPLWYVLIGAAIVLMHKAAFRWLSV